MAIATSLSATSLSNMPILLPAYSYNTPPPPLPLCISSPHLHTFANLCIACLLMYIFLQTYAG